MRHGLLRSIIWATTLAVPVVGVAAAPLTPIMETWSHSKSDVNAMLTGRAPYDETQIRSELQHYVELSRLLAREVNGGSEKARDLKARFRAFADDSQSALAEVSQRATVAANFNRMLADCQFCHAIYAN